MPALLEPADARVLTRVMAPAEIEWRDATGTGDGSYTFLGHAAVVDVTTTLFEGKSWVWKERIAPGAFTKVLASRPDVHFNLNHDMSRAMARTGIVGVGGLELSEDQRGLRAFARLDPEDPDVQALAVKMKRGVIDQMSFAFRIGEMETLISTDDQGREVEEDTILEVSDLFDVCACAQGAYPQTDASLRSLMAALGRAGIDPAGLRPHRASAGAENTTIAPADPAGGDDLARKRAALARKRRIALLRI